MSQNVVSILDQKKEKKMKRRTTVVEKVDQQQKPWNELKTLEIKSDLYCCIAVV